MKLLFSGYIFLSFFLLSVCLSIHPSNQPSIMCLYYGLQRNRKQNQQYVYIYISRHTLSYCTFYCASQILLFFLFCFLFLFFFLNKLNVVANLCQASLLVPFFFSFFWWGVAGCTCSIWKLPRQGFNWRPMPQQHGIQAMSVIYTTAHNNARSPAHRARPGIE